MKKAKLKGKQKLLLEKIKIAVSELNEVKAGKREAKDFDELLKQIQ